MDSSFCSSSGFLFWKSPIIFLMDLNFAEIGSTHSNSAATRGAQPHPPSPRGGLSARWAAGSRRPSAFFQWSASVECHFLNGTERVRFVVRHVYNRQQYVHFDSDVGLFVADTVLGEPSAELFNAQPDVLEKNRAAAEMLCAHNYHILAPVTLQKREPRLRVVALPSGSASHRARLACHVSGFYPPDIEVKWFRNGKEESERAVSTGVIRNGDWTYQLLLLLDPGPQPHGDTYVCHVEHASLPHPKTQPWEPPAHAGRSELLLGVGGLVLGLAHLLLGLLAFLRAKGAERWGGGAAPGGPR
ncbi:class II histocompatibility antigen, B-L beta chain-like [Cyrtonyx montezumae]|uniref:class II histocompatibility antigen, B-L beta chain-like n=1 Tax=Cyrtonyx montezumae TaxID=9017 RepID=UPI0032DB74E8